MICICCTEDNVKSVIINNVRLEGIHAERNWCKKFFSVEKIAAKSCSGRVIFVAMSADYSFNNFS